MPTMNVVDVYSINKKNAQGIMVVIEKTAELADEDLVDVRVDFKTPSGQVMEVAIEKVMGFKDNLHLFFSRLNKLYKPIGFTDPNEERIISFDTNSIA